MTPEVLKKLEEAAAMDCTIDEMTLYAGISNPTYYKYVKENPDFLERLQHLRSNPALTTRTTLISSLKTIDGARWYAEKKLAKEFGKAPEAPAFLQQNFNLFLNPSVRGALQAADETILKAINETNGQIDSVDSSSDSQGTGQAGT